MRGVRRLPIALLALAVVAPGFPAGAKLPDRITRIGVEMPAAGDDGALGLAVSQAIRLAAGPGRVVARDSANGGFQNAHRDEGSDNAVDRRTAPSIIAAFAADPRVVAAVGGLRRNVGDADAAAAEARGLPVIVLSRWSRSPGGTSAGTAPRQPNAFCLCVSPPRLVALARAAARTRFGPRLLVALAGEAGTLPAQWPHGFDGVAVARLDDGPGALASVRRDAAAADAVLVVADERPPTLWRSAVFRRRFDGGFLTRLGHRDFRAVPEGLPRGDVLVVREAFADGPARPAFARRFRAAAGFLPGDEAVRGYAAGEVVRAAAFERSGGSDRAGVRRALRQRRFATVAGPVTFDADGYRADGRVTAAPS